MSYDEQPDDIHGECALEIKRLEEALRYEENRFSRIGTHSDVCWAWGPSHYECAMRHALELKNQIIAKDARIAELRDMLLKWKQAAAQAEECELDEYAHMAIPMPDFHEADNAMLNGNDLSVLAENDRQVRRNALLNVAAWFESITPDSEVARQIARMAEE